MAGDPFTSTIFRWLNTVAADPSLPPAAFKLAYIISQHINRGTHQAWPSQTTLKEAIGVKDERSVRRLTEALEEGGHLITRRRKQTSMIYRLAQDRTELSYQVEPEETEGEPRPDKNDRSSNSRPDIPVPKTGHSCPPRPDKNVRLTTESNHLKNQEGERARATLIPDDFRISDQTYSWALDKLGSNEAVERSVERFKNHYRQVDGAKAKSRDWEAKARNWIDDDASKIVPDKSVHAAAKRLQEKILSFNERPSAITDEHWDAVLSTYVANKLWTRHVDQFGPEPSSPECRVPRRLLIKHGIAKEAAA
jgi:DNA-binding transcriptional ArsR family regulator